jgi:DNA-binding response OmpR family regulator
MSDAKPNHNVLVVEDDPEINELVGAYVKLSGFGYRVAMDGAAALRLAREQLPALIILDVMLPDTDGFAVCVELRKDVKTAKVPVLMLTALNREDCKARGKACGAVEYLTKPFDPDQLLAAIKKHAKPH